MNVNLFIRSVISFCFQTNDNVMCILKEFDLWIVVCKSVIRGQNIIYIFYLNHRLSQEKN